MSDDGLDFSGAPEATDTLSLSDKLNRELDSIFEQREADRRPWPVLSPSMLNGVCSRRVAYDYFGELEAWANYQELKDKGEIEKWHRAPKFAGKMLRIFERGHDDETKSLRDLRALGFVIVTTDDEGKQYGFKTCFDGDWARLRGRIDGIVLSSPLPEVATPCLWEHKALNHKTATAIKSGGLQKHKPNYYQQVQTYMPFMCLTDNPCFFTFRNKDNETLNSVLVPFDPEESLRANEWLAKVLEAERPEDLPQAGVSMTAPECKWCDHRDRCWTAAVSTPAASIDAIRKPSWI